MTWRGFWAWLDRSKWWIIGSVLFVVWIVTIAFTWTDEEVGARADLYVNFGVAREPTTSTAVLNLCAPEDSEQPECQDTPSSTRPDVAAAFVAGDLRGFNTSARFPVDQVTVNAVNVGVDGLQIKVSADALQPKAVQDGQYVGTVVVERALAAGDEPLAPQSRYRVSSELVINLTHRTPARALLALLALALGAFLGAGTKWVNETLAPFAVFRRRWTRIHRRLARWWSDLPDDAQDAIRETRLSIREDDSTDVASTLDSLTQQQTSLISFARAIRDIREEIDKQRRALARVPAPEYADSALEALATLVRDLRDMSWPWRNPTETETKWEAARRNARLVTREIRVYASAPSTSRREGLEQRFAQVAQAGPDGLTTDLPDPTSAERDRFDEEKVERLEQPRELESGPEASAHRETPPKRKERLLDGLPLVTTAITGVAVVAVGMLTQFFRSSGFDGGIIAYLVLGGWAFATQVAGITVLELGGQLRGASPTAPQ